MPASKRKILLVDEDKFLIELYVRKFREAGFEVCAVYSAEDALGRLRQGFVADAILLDLVMSGLGGLEMIRIIRKESLDRGAAMIILTNQGEARYIAEAKEAGIDGYILKASTPPAEVCAHVLEIMEYNKR